MNANLFSLYGYIGVLLWLTAPVLWWVAFRGKNSSRWLCPAALVATLFALVFAKINSETHVNRIQVNQEANMDAVRAKAEAKRKAMEEKRGDDVADIRFAEDGSEDFLDKGGMDDSDLKYMESLGDESEPEWKKTKKKRGASEEEKKGLDAKLGGEQAIQGVDSSTFEEKDKRPPIIMSEEGKATAERFDKRNHSVIDVMIVFAVIMCVVDYLARSNVYASAYLPLPLPSVLPNVLRPYPPLVERGAQPRRPVLAELEWIVKRGDCFLFFTDDPDTAATLPASLPRLGKSRKPVEVLSVNHPRVTDEFAFEALWYGRCCLVVDSPERANRMFASFLGFLEERRLVGAKVQQAAHVVWDAKHPLADAELAAFSRLARATGFSLFICNGNDRN